MSFNIKEFLYNILWFIFLKKISALYKSSLSHCTWCKFNVFIKEFPKISEAATRGAL